MSFTFLENAFDNEQPFFSGQAPQGPPPGHGPSQQQAAPARPNNSGLSEMSQYPPTQGTPYGAPRGGSPSLSQKPAVGSGAAHHPMHAQPYPPPRQQPVSSGAPMDQQEVVNSHHQQKHHEEVERRHHEQLYAMGKFVTKQQEDNALVMRAMKQYSSSLEILLFIVIAFCVVMVIVQIIICQKVMTLTKITQGNNNG